MLVGMVIYCKARAILREGPPREGEGENSQERAVHGHILSQHLHGVQEGEELSGICFNFAMNVFLTLKYMT